MSRRINWGLIGLGKMADVFISTLKEVPKSKVKGIASKNQGSIERISNSFIVEKENGTTFCSPFLYQIVS